MNTHLIRNLFHQYTQPENRVTHALAQVLTRSPRLLRDFVRFAVEVDPPAASLSLSCQVFPDGQQQGEQLQTLSEEEAERQGIPDLWIWNEPTGWAILCECKVTALPTVEQLRRHVETARRFGFKQANLLVITADESRPVAVPNRVNGLPVAWTSWARVFAFLSHRHRRDGHLVAEFLDYLRVAEAQVMAEGRDIPPLTTFAGIRFGPDYPYTELEAKSVLRALMAEVRPRLAKSSVLRIEPAIRRPALVGAWDVIGLKGADLARPFNEYPHLTVGIDRDRVTVMVTLPHGAPRHWRRIRAADAATLRKVLGHVAQRVNPLRRRVERDIYEPQLRLWLSQRHFYAQRFPTPDGEISFDVRSLFIGGRKSSVKHVPAWLGALHAVLAQTARANFEMQLQARYPLRDGSLVRKPEFVGTLVRTAEAFQPFVTYLLGGDRQKDR